MDWASVVAALIVTIGGVLAYSIQKRVDQKAHLVRYRQDTYSRYLAAHQRVVTNTIRTVHEARRLAIDELRAEEMNLLLVAPIAVAQQVVPLRSAFMDYTRIVRSKYERHAVVPGLTEEQAKLSYQAALKEMLRLMRMDTLGTADSINYEEWPTRVSESLEAS